MKGLLKITQNAMESDNRNQQTNEDLEQTRKLTIHRKLILPIFGNTSQLCAKLKILQFFIVIRRQRASCLAQGFFACSALESVGAIRPDPYST
jgi:hypothetical protein